MGATLRQQLLKELDKATPEFLWQIFQFVQFLKQAERKTVSPEPGVHPLARFVGCMTPQEGDALATLLEHEFSQIEGEW